MRWEKWIRELEEELYPLNKSERIVARGFYSLSYSPPYAARNLPSEIQKIKEKVKKINEQSGEGT